METYLYKAYKRKTISNHTETICKYFSDYNYQISLIQSYIALVKLI